jgi:hypothetical protein
MMATPGSLVKRFAMIPSQFNRQFTLFPDASLLCAEALLEAQPT